MGHFFEMEGLRVTFVNDKEVSVAVDNVSYYVNNGEVVSFVGESGSGKTVAQLAALQLLPVPPAKIESGKVIFEGSDLLQYHRDSAQMRAVRGGAVGMVFQEPMTSLNPVKTIGVQLMESIILHQGAKEKEAREKAAGLLKQVGIPDPVLRLNDYPHQFSGGMRQRIMIAIAMAGNPRLIIADEPTTALDVTTQAQILDLLMSIAAKNNTAVLLITHNLGIVARYAQRIYVMYAGSIVESGKGADIFGTPAHPYTKGLLKAVPRLDDTNRRLIPIDGVPPSPNNRKTGCQFQDRCPHVCSSCRGELMPPLREVRDGHYSACLFTPEEISAREVLKEEIREEERTVSDQIVLNVEHLKVSYPIRSGFLQKKIGDLVILDDISFQIRKGETLGFVGESGCGKTTAAKAILKLLEGTRGKVGFHGTDLLTIREKDFRPLRRKIQMIFQDPFSSLDPRKSSGDLVGEALLIHKLAKSRDEYDKQVDKLFGLVGLDSSMKNRVAHEFSGGQRQRIGIARALAGNPEVLICDEPISALDVSIQAQIINLLQDLQQQLQLTYLFIAHDLSVVKHISHRVAVMYMGNIVEFSTSEDLYENARHPYTQALLSAVPIPDPKVEAIRERKMLPGEVPSIRNRPHGCCFNERCREATQMCREKKPELIWDKDGHGVACYKYKGDIRG